MSLSLSQGVSLLFNRELLPGTNVTFDITPTTLTINSAGGAGGGAPTDASYLTLGLHAGLSAERVLTAGGGISFSDGGVNGTLTVINADRGSVAVTSHEGAADPHTQYFNVARGDARYSLLSHTHLATHISDSTVAGRNLLTAVDVPAQRTFLGLGTAALNATGDFAPIAHVGSGGTQHALVVAAGAAGFMSGADKTKLDGIQAGATANSTDTALRDRTTHTGVQPASTISDFSASSRAQTEAMLLAGTNISFGLAGSGDTRTLTINASGGGSGVETRDEGSVLGTTSSLNFVGAGVTASGINPTVVTIPGGGGVTVQDEGAPLGTTTTLNFTGAGVIATGINPTTINIPGGGAGAASVKTTLVIIPFGRTRQEVTVVDAAISPGMNIMVSQGATANTDENEQEMDAVTYNAVAQAGQFVLTVATNFRESLGGAFRINYSFGT